MKRDNKLSLEMNDSERDALEAVCEYHDRSMAGQLRQMTLKEHALLKKKGLIKNE